MLIIKKQLWLFVTLALLTLIGLAAFFFISKPKASSIWEPEVIQPFKQWYQINWYSQAVGWASIEFAVTQDKFTITEQDFIEGRVQGEVLKFSFKRELSFSNKKPYMLLSGSVTFVEPNLVVSSDFSNDNFLVIEGSRNNKAFTSQKEKIDYRLTDFFELHQFVENQPIKNSEVIVKEFNVKDFAIIYSRYKVLTQETQESTLYKNYRLSQVYQNTSSLADAVRSKPTVHKMTRDGVSYSIQRPSGIEWIASKGKVSLNSNMQKDLYLESGISINQKIGKPANIKNIELFLRQGKISWFNKHPDVVIRDNQIILNKGSRYQASEQEIDSLNRLKRNYHQATTAKATDLTSGLTSEQQKVNLLVHWVNQYLEYKTLPSGFNLDEILEQKIGDCTEHAMLLSEMLNSIGMPAREISGLVYLGDEKQLFGGHVWVEVLLDGFWIAVDPTWNLTEVTATHIPMSLGQAGYLDNLSRKSNLTFELKEINYINSKH